jgi:hypothetical protein
MHEVQPAVTSLGPSMPETASPGARTDPSGTAAAGSGSPSPAGGFSLVDAAASLAGRNGVVTEVVIGGNNQISAIRILDSVTHQVVAESPPESIAHMREEILAYQDVVRGSKPS